MNHDRPRCVACSKVLRPEEQRQSRITCCSCEDRAKESLTHIGGEKGLFARLVSAGSDALVPGSYARSERVSNFKTAPLPLNLSVLNITSSGGALTTLKAWVTTWFNDPALQFTVPTWSGPLVTTRVNGRRELGQVDRVVNALVNNLPWAAEHRVDFRQFATQVRRIESDIADVLDPSTRRTPGRTEVGRCPVVLDDGYACFTKLFVYPGATSIRCESCGSSWRMLEWPDLMRQMNSA